MDIHNHAQRSKKQRKKKVKKDRITPKTVNDDIKYIISEHKNNKTLEQLLIGNDKDLTEHQKYVISEMKKGNPLQNTSIYLCFYDYQPTSSSGSGVWNGYKKMELFENKF